MIRIAHARSYSRVAAALLAASLPAQVPPHGVNLDPSIILNRSAIARDGDRVHIVGVDNLFPSGLRHAHSTDGGRTWPAGLVTLGHPALDVSLAVVGNRVFVASLGGSANPGRWLVASFDGGATWRPPVSLPPGNSVPQVQARGVDVNVFCVGSTWTQEGVYLVHSGNGGLSWSAPVDLAVGLPAGSWSTDANLQIVADGSEIHLFWNRHTPLIHTAHQRSMDGGATWLPVAQWITNAPLAGAASGAGRLFVQAGSTMWRSTNHGVTWSPVPGHGFAYPVALAMDGANMLAVEVAPVGTGQMLRMATSGDAGTTWSVSATTTTYPVASSVDVQAAVAGTAMFLRRPGGSSLGELHQSDDSGGTWRQIAGDANIAFQAGRDGAVALTHFNVLPAGLWVWVLEGHTRFGIGSAGSGALVPTLTGRGLAGLGRTFQLELGNALGGTLAAYLLGYGSAVYFPLGASWIYVGPPSMTLVVTTSGQTGQPGAGSAMLPVAIPLDPTLIGLRLLSQCFVLDPGVPAGFCASAARESWIR